ncbi:Protein CBG28133 [Caenorhabditis briggsae]|uniref:Protein CBG28133 n=1 Tax=Caenorhabditis briggsae TaxID=6238 RepID=B6IHX3_CAEBR|nr:Protein CBG28133 [Caenorhabditis briggsae]CAR99503.1 Protein CBG28133 [Caenorhabditis briggsae]
MEKKPEITEKRWMFETEFGIPKIPKIPFSK